MNWLSIKAGRKRPTTWKAVQPNFFHTGFKATAFFPEHCAALQGQHRLFGKTFLSGDSIAIDWRPCLEVPKIALYLNVVSSGMEYSYSLVSVSVKRPISLQLELNDHQRIVASVDSFEGIFKLIITQESFRSSRISFDLLPKLKTPAQKEINSFISVKPIRKIQ